MGSVINILGCDCKKKEDDEGKESSESKEEGKAKTSNEDNRNKSNQEIEPKSDIIPQNGTYKSELKKKISRSKLIRKGLFSFLDRYPNEKYIGKGLTGNVFLITSEDNEKRVKKLIKKDPNNKKQFEEIEKEIDALKKLDHPNIVKIYGVNEDKDNYMLINEFCDQNDLASIKSFSQENIFCEFLVKYIMYQVFMGVKYLHDNNYSHGDIKIQNMAFISMGGNKSYFFPCLVIDINKNKELQKKLLETKEIKKLDDDSLDFLEKLQNFSLKLIDFGSVDIFQRKDEILSMEGKIVTKYYLSPEGFKGQSLMVRDEFACGVTMYYLLTGNFPFLKNCSSQTLEEIGRCILYNDLDLEDENLKDKTPACIDLIKKLLIKDPNERIKVNDVFDHPFFHQGISIKELLEYNFENNDENKLIRRAFNSCRKNLTFSQIRRNFKQTVISFIAYNNIKQEEEKRIRAIFYRLVGGNVNYSIDKKTFGETLRSFNNKYTEKDVNNLFDEIDYNKNGKIEYQELINGFSNEEELLTEQNLRDAFDFFDVNKDKKITWNEIEEKVFGEQKNNYLKEQFLQEIGQEDGNVKMSFEEFKHYLID